MNKNVWGFFGQIYISQKMIPKLKMLSQGCPKHGFRGKYNLKKYILIIYCDILTFVVIQNWDKKVEKLNFHME